ncbi:zf-HC2 domain-containing protein [Nocardioides sp. cx-169]|uniref:anti-sigma factor family protein n=1 Tax=Nocardioides sp. cx-169 TaxID=2899080 RepID=UPI001E3CC13A|nr:zf-HC2 domain-containing protein [Nocardioides sp. cx-169]MCD4533901.1 zf-HC2 domain-containing protein [Nocardioides sp. cx-169]
MIGHLGNRVSALLDGQLSAEETERAWAHVHTCHTCRDRVEHEGWVKTRLAGLSFDSGSAPDHLKGSLLEAAPGGLCFSFGHGEDVHRTRRNLGIAAIGGGAVGAAVMGVLALGAAPADAPTIDRRAPSMQVTTPSPSPVGGQPRRPLP